MKTQAYAIKSNPTHAQNPIHLQKHGSLCLKPTQPHTQDEEHE